MDRIREEQRMKRRVVTKDDGTRHLVVGASADIHMGTKLTLLGLDEVPRTLEEVAEADVRPVHDPTPGGRGALLRILLANRRAQERGGGGLALRCNTMFKPFQFRPLVKFQGEADGRLLISDETGLGKTVEAGYILAEEYAAGRANRILLMVPKRSLDKWRRDMRGMFGLLFEKASKKRILDGINDPSASFHLITTHDVGRKTPGWWDELEGSLDVLLIDEIHRHINPGKIRRPMSEALSAASGSVLGLTATPVRKEAEDLFRILELIYPGLTDGLDSGSEMLLLSVTNALTRALEEGDAAACLTLCDQLDGMVDAAVRADPRYPRSVISTPPPWDSPLIHQSVRFLRRLPTVSAHITRARGRDPEIDEHNERIVHDTHWFEPEGTERDIISRIDDLLRREFHHTHRQQLASCRPAMLELMEKGAQGLRAFDRDGKAASLSESSDSETIPEDEDVNRECEEMVRLLRRIGGGLDDKFDDLVRLLERLKDDPSITKAVIFTHFHPTYDYLRRRLGVSRVFEGDTKMFLGGYNDDDEKLQAINDQMESHDGFGVLLTTDRMSEAVDLHAANCVISYDLPYNPQDLQQRIGRVDRIIQNADEIHVHNFAVRGTVDDTIVERIVERSRIFESIVGGMEDVASEMTRAESTGSDVSAALGRIQEQLDRDMLAAGGESFRLVDRVFDESILEARSEQSPFLDREHMVLLELFNRINPAGDHSWDSDSGTLRLAVDRSLAMKIHDMLGGEPEIGGLMFAKLVRAAKKTGCIDLRIHGRKGSIGPAHAFSKWATECLSAMEGVEDAIEETGPPGVAGSMSLVEVSGSKIREAFWLSAEEGAEVSDWLTEIGASEAGTEVTGIPGPLGWEADDERVAALVKRDGAEHERLLRRDIRRLHAIRIRLEESSGGDDEDDRVRRIAEKISELEELPGPSVPKVSVLHRYRANAGPDRA